ncbi:helix-turn-helix domain-containing protein [Streptomyces sp. SID13031]|uniref:NB-ARC domain-containing protein n=2 Tax=Bacteria TaxID=2 RepID=UPI0013CA61EE|nr:helix-turn-helix domain-containing protein [Streptomyces sp. SID13031]
MAELLRRFRVRAKLTQEALAEAAGLSARAIRVLEGGQRRYPRRTTLDQLAAALELSADEIQLLEVAARRPSVTDHLGIPRQVPAGIADFTGRTEQLAQLIEVLGIPLAVAPAVVVVAISGMGGVGKTTLAVEAARQVADEFPDGQLYVNLRGGSEPRSTADALLALLQSLGVQPVGTTDVQVLAKHYRTALAGRRMLIVLDDAAGAAQVVPLIPGTSSSAVVITSRQRLFELPGARHLDLDVLPEPEAIALLGEVVGSALVNQNPAAALQVVRRCGLLPLAIRIAGGHSSKTAAGFLQLAATLADDSGRLDALTGSGRVVNRSVAVSLAALSVGNAVDVAAAETFPLLACFDGDWFPLRAAAKVLGRSMDDTEDLLERLVDLHLLETRSPYRYHLHDLVRDVGRDLARTVLSEAALADAFHRELECYLAMLWRYAELLGVVDLYGSWTATSWSAEAADQTDPGQVLSWLEGELANLVRLVRAAAAGDEAERLAAVRLALGMPRLARTLMRFAEAYDAMSAVVTLPVELDISLEQGRLYQMSSVSGALGLIRESLTWGEQELPLARAIGEPTRLSASLVDLAENLGFDGRAAEGLRYAEEALSLVVDTGASTNEAGANLAVGILAGQMGDLARQQAMFARAIELLLATRPVSAALGWRLIGVSLRESGQHKAALTALNSAIELARGAKTEALEGTAITEIGVTWFETGDYSKSCDVLAEAVAIAVRHPQEHQEARPRHQRGRALAELGMVAEARLEWEKAIALYERIADPQADEVRGLLAGLAQR